jgi:hypothetical protein
MVVVVLSKLDKKSLIYGCGNVISCVKTCVSKGFFDIERFYLMVLMYQVSIDAELNYLLNESSFIEIGQKLIELWQM